MLCTGLQCVGTACAPVSLLTVPLISSSSSEIPKHAETMSSSISCHTSAKISSENIVKKHSLEGGFCLFVQTKLFQRNSSFWLVSLLLKYIRARRVLPATSTFQRFSTVLLKRRLRTHPHYIVVVAKPPRLTFNLHTLVLNADTGVAAHSGLCCILPGY